MAPNTTSRMAGRIATERKDVCDAIVSTSLRRVWLAASPAAAAAESVPKAASPPAAVVLAPSKICPIIGSTK